jgi:hypothetical protein
MPFDDSIHIRNPSSSTGTPLPWIELKFNPVGLYNLRRHLTVFPKQPGLFERYKQRFIASDLAWFAAGASEDGTHSVPPNTFHQSFEIARENLQSGAAGKKNWAAMRSNLQQLTFDLVR